MASKLTPKLEREVLKRAAGGESSEAIASWLKKSHGISITGQALRKRLKDARIDRGEAIKAVVREELGPTVKSDIGRLETIRAQIQEDRELARGVVKRMAKGEKAPDGGTTWDVREAMVWSKQYVKLTELELKAIHEKLHFSGADSDDERNTKPAVHVYLPPESGD